MSAGLIINLQDPYFEDNFYFLLALLTAALFITFNFFNQ
jgi:hypothetical protein